MSSPLIPTMRDRMLAGQPYVADSTVKALYVAAQEREATYNASEPGDPARRRALLEELLGSIGQDVEVRPPLHVDLGSRITIGDRTTVDLGLTALDVAEIRIGADCRIGPHVQILTPLHPLDAEQRRARWESAAPVTIGDNVWIGGGTIISPGVTIGDGSVIGAGSVVVSDIAAGVLAVGNPAKVIRTF